MANQFSSFMIKINIPGITFKSFVFTSWPHSFVCGLFVLCFSLVWRVQFALRGKAAGSSTADIPKMDTAKFQAGPLMNHPVPKQVLGAHAVFNTVVWESALLSPTTSRIEKDVIVANLATGVVTGTGAAKVLSSKQLNHESITLHRRGLVSQVLGKIQGESVYSPNTIVSGVDIYNMTFKEFFAGFLGVCDSLGIPKEIIGISLHPSNFSFETGCQTISGLVKDQNPPVEFSTPVTDAQLESYGLSYIKLFLAGFAGDKASLTFNDGIPLSYEGNNLMPMELGLPIARLTPPSAISPLTEDPSDPYTALANSQIKEFNSSIKTVRLPKTASSPSPTAGRRRGRPPGGARGSKKNS